MYIDLSEIACFLQSSFNVELFHISSPMPVSDLLVFPHASGGRLPELNPDNAYLCEFRDLRDIDPQKELPPLICIVDPRSHPDEIFFRHRQAIIVYHSSVTAVLTELTHAAYLSGTHASGILDISRALLHCAGVDELLDTAFSFLGNPLIVTDAGQKIFACTPPELVPDSVYGEITALSHLPVGHPLPEQHVKGRADRGLSARYPR